MPFNWNAIKFVFQLISLITCQDDMVVMLHGKNINSFSVEMEQRKKRNEKKLEFIVDMLNAKKAEMISTRCIMVSCVTALGAAVT